MESKIDQNINSVEIIVRSEIADKSSMDGLENNAEESNAMKRIIRERNPESKLGMDSKETDQSFRDIYENINTEHDKCSVALGGEMLGNEYQYMHDSIAPTANNDDSHVPTSASEALGMML